MGDHGGTLKIKYDVIRTKTKLSLTRFTGTIGMLKFDEKTFLLLFSIYTTFGLYNYQGIKDKIHVKCDVIDGSVVKGIREPGLFRFISSKSPGSQVFCQLETIQYRKINKCVFNTITFYLDNKNDEKVDLVKETLTFT